jgi:hypothetical protein
MRFLGYAPTSSSRVTDDALAALQDDLERPK